MTICLAQSRHHAHATTRASATGRGLEACAVHHGVQQWPRPVSLHPSARLASLIHAPFDAAGHLMYCLHEVFDCATNVVQGTIGRISSLPPLGDVYLRGKYG